MVNSLSDMVLRGQAIQVHLEPLDRLESLMADVQEWKESAASTFVQKDSTLTLLEVKAHIYKISLVNSLCVGSSSQHLQDFIIDKKCFIHFPIAVFHLTVVYQFFCSEFSSQCNFFLKKGIFLFHVL